MSKKIQTGILEREANWLTNPEQVFEGMLSTAREYTADYANTIPWIEKIITFANSVIGICDKLGTKNINHAETKRDCIAMLGQCDYAKQLLSNNDKSAPLAMLHLGILFERVWHVRPHEADAKSGKKRSTTNAKAREKHSKGLAARNKRIITDVQSLLAHGITQENAIEDVAHKHLKTNGEPLSTHSIATIWKNRTGNKRKK